MINMKEWLHGLSRRKTPHALPVLTSPGMKLIGEKADTVFRCGEMQFRVIQALTTRFPMAAAMTMMDLSVEAEAFGAPIIFSEDENPNIAAAILEDLQSIQRLNIPEVGTARTAECLRAARLCSENISDRPTLGGLIGPFSLAGRLLPMNHLMLLTVTEPETVHLLLEKTTQFLVAYAKAFKAAGCGGLLMAEPAAGLISPQMAEAFSYHYIQRVVDVVQDEHFVFILHNCGKTEKMVNEMLSTGASALHVGNAVDITKILKQTPPTVPVMGNIDPTGVFLMAAPEDVFRAAVSLLDATREFPHFVLSSGCDIPPGTPLENIQAFFDALQRFPSVPAEEPGKP